MERIATNLSKKQGDTSTYIYDMKIHGDYRLIQLCFMMKILEQVIHPRVYYLESVKEQQAFLPLN